MSSASKLNQYVIALLREDKIFGNTPVNIDCKKFAGDLEGCFNGLNELRS